MTDERKKALSEIAKARWRTRRDEISRNMRHPRSSGIEVSQSEDYTTYQREYQRKYREKHPEYYKNLQKRKRQESQ